MLTRVITGVTGDQAFPACWLRTVRVAGTANLVGAVQIKRDGNVIETIPAAATPGTERDFDDTKFDTLGNLGVLNINMANAGDTVIVTYN
jgi:hypothetical protein